MKTHLSLLALTFGTALPIALFSSSIGALFTDLPVTESSFIGFVAASILLVMFSDYGRTAPALVSRSGAGRPVVKAAVPTCATTDERLAA